MRSARTVAARRRKKHRNQKTLVMSRNRASSNQLEELLWFMETHRTFAKGHITDLGCLGHDKYKQIWKDLTDKLNNIGPIRKSVAAWMKTWRLLKNAAKKRKAQYTVQMNRTGNVSPVDTLTDFDARITSIFGKYGTGLCVIEEIGTPRDPRDATESHEVFDEEIKKPIPLHIVEEELSHNLHSLRCQNDITKGMFEKVSNHFVELIAEFFSKLERLRKLRETKRIKSRSNQPQLKQMVEFMERHSLFANDKLRDERASATLWEELATNLNYLGDKKNVKGWMKTWNDLVKSVQQRQTSLNSGMRNTPVPALDFRVLAIVEKVSQPVPQKDLAPQASQKFDSYSQSTLTTNIAQSNHSALFRDRSPLLSRNLSPQRYSRHTPSLASHRSVHGSPHKSPMHSSHCSPYRSSIYSPNRSGHHSSLRSPHRTSIHSPSRSGHHSPLRSPHHTSIHSPSRSGHHSLLRSPHRTSIHSPSRSGHHSLLHTPPSARVHSSGRSGHYSRSHTSHHSPLHPPHRSSHRSSLPSPRSNLSHRVESSAPGPSHLQSSSAKAKPRQVPFVDLTRLNTPAASRLKHSTAAKDRKVTTSAVVESMDAYVAKMTAFGEQVVKCFENQNSILQEGFLRLSEILQETAEKVVNNYNVSKCEIPDNTDADSFNMQTDHPSADEEDRWPAEYLE